MHIVSNGEQLTDRLLAVVTAALRRSRRAETEVIKARGLSLSQYKILALLDCETDGMGPSEIAQQIGLTPGATSRATEALVKDGLLVRSEDATDRRIRTLTLSEAGRGAAGPLWSARRGAIFTLVESLSESQQTALTAALEPLMEALGEVAAGSGRGEVR